MTYEFSYNFFRYLNATMIIVAAATTLYQHLQIFKTSRTYKIRVFIKLKPFIHFCCAQKVLDSWQTYESH